MTLLLANLHGRRRCAGHGQSEGERVHVERWDDFAEGECLSANTFNTHR